MHFTRPSFPLFPRIYIHICGNHQRSLNATLMYVQYYCTVLPKSGKSRSKASSFYIYIGSV